MVSLRSAGTVVKGLSVQHCHLETSALAKNDPLQGHNATPELQNGVFGVPSEPLHEGLSYCSAVVTKNDPFNLFESCCGLDV